MEHDQLPSTHLGYVLGDASGPLRVIGAVDGEQDPLHPSPPRWAEQTLVGKEPSVKSTSPVHAAVSVRLRCPLCPERHVPTDEDARACRSSREHPRARTASVPSPPPCSWHRKHWPSAIGQPGIRADTYP